MKFKYAIAIIIPFLMMTCFGSVCLAQQVAGDDDGFEVVVSDGKLVVKKEDHLLFEKSFGPKGDDVTVNKGRNDRGNELFSIPLEEVAGKTKMVPPDHPLIGHARTIDTCLGDKT